MVEMKKGLYNYAMLGAVLLVALVALSWYYSKRMEGFYDVNPEQQGVMCKVLKEQLQAQQVALNGASDTEHKKTITESIAAIQQQMTAATCPE
jgi:hypothetical protein